MIFLLFFIFKSFQSQASRKENVRFLDSPEVTIFRFGWALHYFYWNCKLGSICYRMWVIQNWIHFYINVAVAQFLGLWKARGKKMGFSDIGLYQWMTEASFSHLAEAEGRRTKTENFWPNTEAEAEYWNFLKLLSICCICSFNQHFNFAYPFLMITFLIHKDPTAI